MYQHHQHERQHQERREEHRDHDNRGRREPRSFDARTHHRIDSRRYVGDRMEVQFEGYWFYRTEWPVWIYNEDVYFVMGPNNVWFAYEYNNPAVFLQVTLVD